MLNMYKVSFVNLILFLNILCSRTIDKYIVPIGLLEGGYDNQVVSNTIFPEVKNISMSEGSSSYTDNKTHVYVCLKC